MKPLHYAQQWLPAMLATGLGTGYFSESNPIKNDWQMGTLSIILSPPTLGEQGWKSQEGLVSQITLCQEKR